MSPRHGRHRKGPGGPRRTGPGRTTPHGPRPGPQVDGLLAPTVAGMVRTLLASAHKVVEAEPRVPGVALEQWAVQLSETSMAAEEMPKEFYVDLAGGLATSSDPLAPAVLAALDSAIVHGGAPPLDRARSEWLVEHRDVDRSADLGIGREKPVAALTIGAEDEDQVGLVVGFTSSGGDHSVGLLVDRADGGIARDLWVGPPIEEIAADARADADLVVTDLALHRAAAMADAAIAAADRSGGYTPEDEVVLALILRRLDMLG